MRLVGDLEDGATQRPWHLAAAALLPKFNAALIIAQRHQRHLSFTVALGAARWRRKASANANRDSSQSRNASSPHARSVCHTIVSSYGAATKIAAVFRGRQARRLLRKMQGETATSKSEGGELTALERWQLRGVVLSAVRLHTLRQRELQRQAAIRGGTEIAGLSSPQPSGFWTLARSGLATDMAAVRGANTSLETVEADVEAVVAVAAHAADTRWRVAHFSAGFTSSARLLHEKSFQRLSQVEGEVVTEADDKERAAALRKWQQGDEELYEADRLFERFQNRNDPQVRQQLNAWWTWAHETFADQDTVTCAERLLMFVSQGMYSIVMLRVHKALLEPEEEWDQDEAEELIEQAWLSDTHGRGKSMSRTEWNDSLFELADMWTLTTEANEYAEFLKRLLDNVRNEEVNSLVLTSFGVTIDDKTERMARHALGREREVRSCTHRLFRSAQLLQGLWRKRQATKKYRKHLDQLFTSAQLIQIRFRNKLAARRSAHADSEPEKAGSWQTPGRLGQMQFWALRKGLPPRLQEEFHELRKRDVAVAAQMDYERRMTHAARVARIARAARPQSSPTCLTTTRSVSSATPSSLKAAGVTARYMLPKRAIPRHLEGTPPDKALDGRPWPRSRPQSAMPMEPLNVSRRMLPAIRAIEAMRALEAAATSVPSVQGESWRQPHSIAISSSPKLYQLPRSHSATYLNRWECIEIANSHANSAIKHLAVQSTTSARVYTRGYVSKPSDPASRHYLRRQPSYHLAVSQ